MNRLLGTILLISFLHLQAQDHNRIKLAHEYYLNGEKDKAQDLYNDLQKNAANIPLIHSNYFALLKNKADYKACKKYLSYVIKKIPTAMNYRVDMAILIKKQNGVEASMEYLDRLVSDYSGNYHLISQLAQYLSAKGFFEHSIKAYQIARKLSRNALQYALEMAAVYRQADRRGDMMFEYLNYARINANTLAYVKRIFQDLILPGPDMDTLEIRLLERIQKHPEDNTFIELIIWSKIQIRDYYGAFLQARAYERRVKGTGARLVQIGDLALKDLAYDDGIRIFDYVAKEYKSSYGRLAQVRSLKAKERKLKETLPLDTALIEELTLKYKSFISNNGVNTETMLAMRNQALLYAFYLDRTDTAIQILNSVIDFKTRNRNFIAKCKIDLGDLYLLDDQRWEATLLYSQVEKANKDDLIGYQAKLKNAKLSYYMGEFELAKSHLDILKQATSREIANDALQLSLIIANNTMMDDSSVVLKKFVEIDFLLFQNKLERALSSFLKILKDYPDHEIQDEVFWKLAEIYEKIGQFDNAIYYLDKILKSHREDIFGDDAHLRKARISELQLGNQKNALELYTSFILDFPGSIYVDEVRKKVRELRGDSMKRKVVN